MSSVKNKIKKHTASSSTRQQPEHANSFDVNKEMRHAIEKHKKGDYQNAEDAYKKILKENPDHPEALHLLGVIAFQFKKYDTATVLIRKAITLNPEQASYYCNLGNILKETDQPQEAIGCYQKALQIQPDNINSLNNLGSALEQLGLTDEAAKCYLEALKHDHNFTDAHINISSILKKQGKINEAIAHLEQAMQNNPQQIQAYVLLADCKKFTKEDKAFEILENLKTQKQNLLPTQGKDICFTLGKMYTDIQDYTMSFQNYQIANYQSGSHEPRPFNMTANQKENDFRINIFDPELFTSRHNYGISL